MPHSKPTDSELAGNGASASVIAQMVTRHETTREPVGRPRWRRFLSLIQQFFAWLIVLSMLSAIVLRIGWHDAHNLLICLNSFTFYIYLPAYALLGLAVVKKKRLLAVACAVVIGFHCTWCLPITFGSKQLAKALPGSVNQQLDNQPRKLRVFFANVYGQNKHPNAWPLARSE